MTDKIKNKSKEIISTKCRIVITKRGESGLKGDKT